MKATNPKKVAKLQLNNWVQIWLARPNENTPAHYVVGGELNEHRLRYHKKHFPDDKLTLISNYKDFPQKHKEYLTELCQELNITLINISDVQDILESGDWSDKMKQLSLLEIAKQEIYSPHGNLAAASDIIRVLSPVAMLGIYKDFDTIKKKNVETHPVYFINGLLVKGVLGGTVEKGAASVTFDQLHNSIIACDESRCNFLKIYRKKMLNRYINQEHLLDFMNDIFKSEGKNETSPTIQKRYFTV